MTSVQGEEQKRIGEYIRQRRKAIKLTQTQLGELLAVGTQAVSDYEKGKIKVIPFEKRVKLADILDVPLADLLYSDERINALKEELGINYLNKEYDLLDALAIELQTDLENINSVEKYRAVKAKFEAFDKKRLEVEKKFDMVRALIDEVMQKAAENSSAKK